MQVNRSATIAVINFVWTFGLALNTRVIAQGNYLATLITDVMLGFLYFTLFKRLQEARGWVEMTAYALGGGIGPLLGIYVSQHFLK